MPRLAVLHAGMSGASFAQKSNGITTCIVCNLMSSVICMSLYENRNGFFKGKMHIVTCNGGDTASHWKGGYAGMKRRRKENMSRDVERTVQTTCRWGAHRIVLKGA